MELFFTSRVGAQRKLNFLEEAMLKSLYVCATTAALALGASNGHAMSINIGAGLKPALDATDVIQKTAVYIVEGRRYCFYFDGWHGAGWYRCGFAHRRNLGWGGEYGWQGWSYGPAAKRYGHGGTTVRQGKTVRQGTTVREGTTVRQGTTVREGTTVRSRSTVREKTQGPSRNVGGTTTIRRSTTGAGSAGDREIKGGGAPTGGGKVQGGVQGGPKAHAGGGKAEGGAQGGKGGGGEKQ
jgi:hypothetical protein